MKAIRLTRLYIQFYAFNTNMNISGGDRLSLTALQRRLSKLCQKLPQKAILGLGEPIINSRILSGGFYLSQHLSITTKVQYMVYHFCKNDKYNFACILLWYVHNVLKWLKKCLILHLYTFQYISIHFCTLIYISLHCMYYIYTYETILMIFKHCVFFAGKPEAIYHLVKRKEDEKWGTATRGRGGGGCGPLFIWIRRYTEWYSRVIDLSVL